MLKMSFRINSVMTLFKKNNDSTNVMIFNVAFAQMYANVLRILGGFITASFVSPGMLGQFNTFALVIAYFPIAQIGIMNALNRQLPFFIGKGDSDSAIKVAETAHAWELSLGILSSTIFFILSIWNLFMENYMNAWGYGCYSIVAFHTFYGINYLQVLYRTNQDFNKLARNAFIVSTASFLLIVLVWLWGFEGLCIRQLLISVCELVLLWIWKPINAKPKINKTYFIDLIKIGVPIYIVGLVFALWSTIGNTLVLRLGGNEAYGLYALALAVVSSTTLLSTSVNQVLYPKMSQAYGSGVSIRNICVIAYKPVLVVFIIAIPLIALVWVIIPCSITFFMPQYEKGILAAQFSVLLIIPSILGVYNLVFNVIRKQMNYLISIICGIIFFIICVFVLYHFYQFNLVIFPISMFVGKMIQLLVAGGFIKHYIKEEGGVSAL